MSPIKQYSKTCDIMKCKAYAHLREELLSHISSHDTFTTDKFSDNDNYFFNNEC